MKMPLPFLAVALGLAAAQSLPAVRAATRTAGILRLTSAVIDRAAGVAWFGTFTAPGKVVQVALGSGNDPPSRLGALTRDPGEEFLACGTLSVAASGYAFFGNTTSATGRNTCPRCWRR
jgi:hypothetical protein